MIADLLDFLKLGKIPTHPAVVHLPMALAILMPVLVLVLWATMGRAWLPRRAWLLAVLFQAILAGTAWVATITGEEEHDKVEAVTGHEPIEEHEEAGETFFVGTLIGLGIFLVASVLLASRMAWGGVAVSFLATLGVLYLGLQAGKLGGSLVYEHGAAGAYAKPEGP